jgi:arylsulfatase A-like enzyme/Flp pilus assembly protein TadD
MRRTLSALLCVGAALSTLLWATACRRTAPGATASPTARHVVLVTIDTLRADRLGCYGSRDVATPNLDGLARDGALAVEATVHVPLTRPSHASLLTGLLPAEHGLRDNVTPPLAGSIPTLAETLRKAGFATGAFVSAVVLSAQSGLGRGFQTYDDRFEVGADDARFLNSIQKRGDVTTASAISWLEGKPGARLFAWLHLYDPHDPYEPPAPYAGRYASRPYDGEVAWSDELVGRLDQALGRLGLRDDTLLVVTSDHGEGLGEHGESVHGFFVYQSTLKVPLLFRGPGIPAGGRITSTVGSIDVMPTVLDLLGVAAPAQPRMSGRSLAAVLQGGPAPAELPAYAESLLPLLHYGWSDLRMLRDGRWKYIQAPRPELYDLAHDPGEERNLADEQAGRAAALRSALSARLEREKANPPPADASAIPPDLLEKLGALGYLGAAAPAPGASTGADPKDKIAEFKVLNRLVREGLLRLRERDYQGSVERLEELSRRGVDSFEVHYYLARALTGLRRHRDAATHFAAAAERLPGYAAAHLGLADARIALGDLRGALLALQRGRPASPRDPRLAEREAQVWRKLKRPVEAVAAYEAAIALAPKDALLRVQLGESLRDAGRLDDSARSLRAAVDLDPAVASYWNALGMVEGARADFVAAEAAFREAVARDAADASYQYNLGLALLRRGKRAEAAEAFRRTLALDPRFAAARARLAEAGG